MMRKILLGCGVIAPVWWIAMDVVGSLRDSGYSYRDQTISELGAQGAPTRAFMTTVSGIPYLVLMLAFAVGIWLAAGNRRTGRATATLVIAEVVWGFIGGIAFPMATRAVLAAGQDTLRNRVHPWYGIGMPILFVLAIGFGSRLLGRRFRVFSYATILAMLVFGIGQGVQAGALTANQPTPWMGVEERITAYAPMLWFVVLAIALLRPLVKQREEAPGTPTSAPATRPLTTQVPSGT